MDTNAIETASEAMNRLNPRWMITWVCLAVSGVASAQDVLRDGDDLQINVPASSGNQIVVNTQFVIDTPTDLTNLFVSFDDQGANRDIDICLLYTSPSPRDLSTSRMPSSA